MKVIGRAGSDRHANFILEASPEEVSRIIGHDDTSMVDNRSGQGLVDVDDTIQVNKMYEQLIAFSVMGDRIAHIESQLLEACGHLAPIPAILKPIAESVDAGKDGWRGDQ